MRSAIGVALAAGLMAAAPAAAAPPAAWKANCLMCHQADGKGTPGLYPRLAGRLDKIAAHPEGRAWMIAVMLHGQTGRIMVDGKPISGVMMPYSRLPDADLVAVLNHGISLGATTKPKPFTEAEVKAARALPRKTATEVRLERERLVEAGIIT